MSKFYTLMSADGTRPICVVTKRASRIMLNNGEARCIQGCNAIRLSPAKPVADPVDQTVSGKRFHLTSRDFRGLSAGPSHRLSERYASAQQTGSDADAVTAVNRWANTKSQQDAT